MGGCSPEEKVMKKKIVLFFRTINSIDTKCDETMFKMKTNCEQNRRCEIFSVNLNLL